MFSCRGRSRPGELAPKEVTATVFWIGEGPSPDNGNIPNRASVWCDDWESAFGGVDDPTQRNGYLPAGFLPKENPFYFALPYSDFFHGKRKANVDRIPWVADSEAPRPRPRESVVKNRWIKVTYSGRIVYGQWQDAGPLGEDDVEYVFGSANPKRAVGLDMSPAMADYLQFPGKAKASWEFVDELNVPNGPWRQIITRSQIQWK